MNRSIALGKPRVFFFTNGILNFPGESKNWNGRAVTRTHTLLVPNGLRAGSVEQVGEKIEYFCGPIGRAFGQKGRADKLHATVGFYRPEYWEHHHVGHSNGAAVILAMLNDFRGWPRIETLHLVCAAAEADFELNGLNRWLQEGRIERVRIYIGAKDGMLRLAHSLPARLLGYGVMGLHGPLNVSPRVARRVEVVNWPEYGHSTCWEGNNFEGTMGEFLD